MDMTTSATTRKDILILGASYAGLSIAHYLLKHIIPLLPSQDSYRVVLLSRSSQTLCRPACPRALLSDTFFDQEKLFVGVEAQLQQYPSGSWKFINSEVKTLSHEDRTIKLANSNGQDETLHYHALVIATGASTPSPLLGLNDNEIELEKAWQSFRAALPLAKHIVIAGGGPTGVEVAGELGDFLNGRAPFYNFITQLYQPKVKITLVTSSAQILPSLRPSVARTAEKYLSELSVTIIKSTKVSSISPPEAGHTLNSLTQPVTLTLSDGQELDADVYIPAIGTQPNTSFMPTSLLAPNGQVLTNPQTLRVDAAGPLIYAIGDASSYARPAIHNILSAVPVLGANMQRDLLLAANTRAPELEIQANETAEKAFKEDTRDTQLVPIGKGKGVGAAMGWRLPSWMVWLVKGRDYWMWTTGKVWSGRQWDGMGVRA